MCGHCHALLLSPYDICTVSRSLSINWPTPAQGDRLMRCIRVLLWPYWVGLCLMCEHAGCSVRIDHQLMPSTHAYMWPSSMGRSLPPTSVRLSTSPGNPRLTTGIPVGKPAGMETRGSELPIITGLHGSGFLFWCCKYLPQVLVRLKFYLLTLLI